MLCSLPAVKGGSNWLNRLRSNKGFPIADNLDLDHFLSNQNSDSDHPNRNLNPNNSHRRESSDNGNPTSYGIITGILSDLFNMTPDSPNSDYPTRKFPRKQSNPKICSIPSFDNADDKNPCSVHKEHNILSSNSDNSSKGGGNEAHNAANARQADVVEEEKAEKELVGYSKTEVTVIDTSCDVWKSDKLIFRRKNVWKVKDKMGKLRSYGRKKRKVTSETTDFPHTIASPSKKTKVWGSEERFHFNAQKLRGKESLQPLNEVRLIIFCEINYFLTLLILLVGLLFTYIASFLIFIMK